MKRRIIALIFSLCIITALFSGCTKDSATLDLDGKLVPVDTLLKVDNNAISLTEYRYYYLTIKENADGGFDSYWNDHEEELLQFKDNVLDEIRKRYAMLALAKDCGIKLSAADRKEIEAYKAYIKEDNGEYYELYLATRYLTEPLFAKLVEQDEIVSLIKKYYFNVNGIKKVSDAAAFDYARSNFQRYKVIYIKPDYDGTTTNLELAESILKRLNDGEKFDELMNTYSRETSVSEHKNGYYYPLSQEGEILSIILSLDENSYNKELYSDESGHYIFMRLGMTDNDLMPDVEGLRSIVEEDILAEDLVPYVNKQKINIVSEYYDDISFTTLY